MEHSQLGLVQLTYYSRNCIDTSKTSMACQINEILETSEPNNQRDGITGALVFDNEWFIQILEGHIDRVWSSFIRIRQDKRHSDVVFTEMKAIQSRRFSKWSMRGVQRNGRTALLFKPYLYKNQFMPYNMSGELILSLLTDLSQADYERRMGD